MEIFCWGRGEDGQLGLGDRNDRLEPQVVDAIHGDDIKQIVCGSGHTVVLENNGTVHTWGRGDDGRLGHGTDNGWMFVPRPVRDLASVKICKVTCGSYHTAAISDGGQLFTWGGGMYGKLGHGDEKGHSLPKLVEGLSGLTVMQVACGSRHTVVLTKEDCQVFAWGDKENGVSGHGEVQGHQYTPRLVDQLCNQGTIQIAACGFHSGAVTADGRVITWGEGKFGRLGHGFELNVSYPHVIDALAGKEVKRIACGGFHTAAVTACGELYTWGGGEHGQLGHGDKVNCKEPTLVKALKGKVITQITCGWSHTVALGSNGTVYTWGNGDHGKLGHNDKLKVLVPKVVEALAGKDVCAIASYNEHTAALCKKEQAVPVPPSQLQSEIGSLINDGQFSDVTFLVEGQPIHAHRAILAARCEHFRAMFSSGMKECHTDEVPIMNVRYETFLGLIRYLYTDQVDVGLEDAAELYMTADLYTLDRLKTLCELQIQKQLSNETACGVLAIAEDMQCSHLKKLCMSYIVRHFDFVTKTDSFEQLSKELMLEVIKNR